MIADSYDGSISGAGVVGDDERAFAGGESNVTSDGVEAYGFDEVSNHGAVEGSGPTELGEFMKGLVREFVVAEWAISEHGGGDVGHGHEPGHFADACSG